MASLSFATGCSSSRFLLTRFTERLALVSEKRLHAVNKTFSLGSRTAWTWGPTKQRWAVLNGLMCVAVFERASQLRLSHCERKFFPTDPTVPLPPEVPRYAKIYNYILKVLRASSQQLFRLALLLALQTMQRLPQRQKTSAIAEFILSLPYWPQPRFPEHPPDPEFLDMILCHKRAVTHLLQKNPEVVEKFGPLHHDAEAFSKVGFKLQSEFPQGEARRKYTFEVKTEGKYPKVLTVTHAIEFTDMGWVTRYMAINTRVQSELHMHRSLKYAMLSTPEKPFVVESPGKYTQKLLENCGHAWTPFRRILGDNVSVSEFREPRAGNFPSALKSYPVSFTLTGSEGQIAEFSLDLSQRGTHVLLRSGHVEFLDKYRRSFEEEITHQGFWMLLIARNIARDSKTTSLFGTKDIIVDIPSLDIPHKKDSPTYDFEVMLSTSDGKIGVAKCNAETDTGCLTYKTTRNGHVKKNKDDKLVPLQLSGAVLEVGVEGVELFRRQRTFDEIREANKEKRRQVRKQIFKLGRQG